MAKQRAFVKGLRRWSRILHRYLGFFLVGASLVYGLSGIALNHRDDWDPDYRLKITEFETDINLKKSQNSEDSIRELLDDVYNSDAYKSHYYPRSTDLLKIFLKGGSVCNVDVETGEGYLELRKKRVLFYWTNYLHYNPNNWWKWTSDVFAGILIFLALSSIFMVRGKKGITGWGGLLAAIGIIIPLLFILLS